VQVQEIIHQSKEITCHQELTVHQEIQEETQGMGNLEELKKHSVHTEVASEMQGIEMEASADQHLGSTHLPEWQTTAVRDHLETHLGTPPGNTLHPGTGERRLSEKGLQEKENILEVGSPPEKEVLLEAQGNTVEEEAVELPVVEGEAEMMTGVGAAAS